MERHDDDGGQLPKGGKNIPLDAVARSTCPGIAKRAEISNYRLMNFDELLTGGIPASVCAPMIDGKIVERNRISCGERLSPDWATKGMS